MKFNCIKIAAVIAATTLFVSCSNDDSPKALSGTYGDAELFFDNGVNGDGLVLGTSYTNSNNETLTIDRLNYIVGNFVLIDADGNEYVYPKNDSFFVISAEDNRATVRLENIPAGDYTKVRFGIGVDQQQYLTGETAQESFWDLASSYDLVWTWSTGYKFILFEGTYTTPQMQSPLPFQVHQGSNTATDNYREVTLDLPVSARVREGEVPSIHLKTDVNVLLDGDNKISLYDNMNPAQTGTAIMGGENLIKIADNSTKMFVVDHVHNGAGDHHEE